MATDETPFVPSKPSSTGAEVVVTPTGSYYIVVPKGVAFIVVTSIVGEPKSDVAANFGDKHVIPSLKRVIAKLETMPDYAPQVAE